MHREIKPEILLIDKKGRVKIADLGCGEVEPHGVGQEFQRHIVREPHHVDAAAPQHLPERVSVEELLPLDKSAHGRAEIAIRNSGTVSRVSHGEEAHTRRNGRGNRFFPARASLR